VIVAPLIRGVAGGVTIALRVIPRSPRVIVGGWRDGRLVVRVTAPPVDGAANTAVIDALAAALGVPKRQLSLVAGETARNKTVRIGGVRPADVSARLSERG
jgi:uncharacterized protein